MNIKMIKSLANIVNEADLSSIEVEQEGFKIKITRERAQEVQISAAPQAAPQALPSAALPEEPVKKAEDSGPGLDFNNIHTIDSPMVGVFYQAAGPGEKPFVQVGSKVKKGDVLCIIVAMKLLNEINAVKDGEIVDICVSDGDVVEYGQTLFKIF
jgi:acetyl-CoA carboxylase biotin carboxyl carrier protein